MFTPREYKLIVLRWIGSTIARSAIKVTIDHVYCAYYTYYRMNDLMDEILESVIKFKRKIVIKLQ